ncbi:hypothetical protein [Candidatus Spongiihabitans sp.]|uniref:hypothetical protein n=1 Tax=Candidatus Spongiihabitans sp. TaxID=3101308 RepID=UPI003C6F1E70
MRQASGDPAALTAKSCAERFNRTIQEQLVDYHEDQLFHDLNGFNLARIKPHFRQLLFHDLNGFNLARIKPHFRQ